MERSGKKEKTCGYFPATDRINAGRKLIWHIKRIYQPDISEETRKKVLRTAEELDYKYREGRRGPRAIQRMSGTIGILAPGSSDLVKSPYYREMLCGMAGEAAECRRDLVIMGEDSAEQEMSWIGRVTARKVDGICLLASREDLYKGRFAELLESGIPLISVENEVTGHTSICRDFRKNAALIMSYLRERGIGSWFFRAIRASSTKSMPPYSGKRHRSLKWIVLGRSSQ